MATHKQTVLISGASIAARFSRSRDTVESVARNHLSPVLSPFIVIP